MRRKLTWLAIFIPAAYFLLVFFAEGIPALGEAGLNLGASELYVSRGLVVVVTLAVGLGVINLFAHHAANVLRRRKEWEYSVIVFISFFSVAGALFWQYHVVSEHRQVTDAATVALQRLEEARKSAPDLTSDQALAVLTAADRAALARLRAYEDGYRFKPGEFYANYVRRPLEATVMALLGFYITYAAYRAFRIRSWEATVMMLSAAVVIVGSDSFGGWLTGGRLTAWADFDNRVLNSGMQRGLLLGIGVAVIAASLRMMLGLERGILASGQSEQ
ncbi:MAG: hypothetical protein ACE5I3_06215 [Phycisphaerae bacterium]